MERSVAINSSSVGAGNSSRVDFWYIPEDRSVFSALGPTEEGIPLEDAIHNPFCLNGRDDLMFVGRGPSISIRLNVSCLPVYLSVCG